MGCHRADFQDQHSNHGRQDTIACRHRVNGAALIPGYLKRVQYHSILHTVPSDMKDPRETIYYREKADDAIRLLLRYGASVDVRAMESGKPSRIKILLQHGAASSG